MAEGFLFKIAEGIIMSLGSLAAKETRLLWGLGDEFEKLENTVSTIKAVLLHAEEQQDANPAIRDWLGKLGDVIHDVDDLLDAVSTEVLRREVMTQDKKAKEVRLFFSKENKLAFGLKLSYKIKAIRGRLDAIATDMKYFQLVERHEETPFKYRERDNTHSFLCQEEVFGRENDKDTVIGLLMNSNNEEIVSILPIVGMGGLGKTTLAQLIFNDEKMQKKFELKMWVCVSDPFDVKSIVQKILESATKRKPEIIEMGTLVNNLRNEIDGKQYLLVLDDVWNEDHEKWFNLKKLLMGGARGSKILVTTRSDKVAKIMHPNPYYLEGLKDHASWNLFKQMAFRDEEMPQNSKIEEIRWEILKRCGGVPLAVKTVGGLLYFKNPETKWLDFIKNELFRIPQNESGILTTLKLSYNKLPSHLKHYFAYCSLFSKDCKIEKSTLINLWIAQGFVRSSENQCLEDVGHKYFMDLLWRSLFQEVEMDEFGNIISCKMHDLMHDLSISEARSLITTFDLKTKNINQKTRHVAVGDYMNFSSKEPMLLYEASMIRTFLCPTVFYFKGEIDCEAIFSNFKLLRVLDLSNRRLLFVPSSIKKLKHLRYLDLRDNRNIKRLSDSITNLPNLQTLRLSGCSSLEELPRDIKKLINLRHLEIDRCWGLRYMPRGLRQLTNLQTLTRFVVDLNSVSKHSGGLNELNGLNNLGGWLGIKGLSHANGVALEYNTANLKEKSRLNSLYVYWSIGGDVNDFDDDLSLEGFQPHPNLKQLYLCHYQGSRLPSWLSSLTSLVELKLIACTKWQSLPSLSQLPSLKRLRLEYMYLQYISDCGDMNKFSSLSAPIVFFPSLRELYLFECPKLKGWWRKDSSVEVNSDNSVGITAVTSMMEHCLLPSFPCLSQLCIEHCPMFTSMPMFPHLEEELYLVDVSCKPLQQTMMMNRSTVIDSSILATSSCTPLSKLKRLRLHSIRELETLPEEWLQNLTSLEYLRIWGGDNLKSLGQGIRHLSALKHLDLGFCPKLELANDGDGMQWQGLKSLLSLSFEDMPKLVSFPLGLQHLTTLQNLEISNCENLTSIPDWIDNWESLEVLRIVGCSSLTSLPERMRGLSSLRILQIVKCPTILYRCKRETGEDWPKIAHIPKLDLDLSQ